MWRHTMVKNCMCKAFTYHIGIGDAVILHCHGWIDCGRPTKGSLIDARPSLSWVFTRIGRMWRLCAPGASKEQIKKSGPALLTV